MFSMLPMTSAFILFIIVFILIMIRRRKPAIYLSLLTLALCIWMFIADITVATAIVL
jgi:hypothetical protein